MVGGVGGREVFEALGRVFVYGEAVFYYLSDGRYAVQVVFAGEAQDGGGADFHYVESGLQEFGPGVFIFGADGDPVAVVFEEGEEGVTGSADGAGEGVGWYCGRKRFAGGERQLRERGRHFRPGPGRDGGRAKSGKSEGQKERFHRSSFSMAANTQIIQYIRPLLTKVNTVRNLAEVLSSLV